jgi:3'-phosphoadenosine 5'-phosphosulfate sulfotransferase (PAPS reductase)/FAD synthetase
MKSIKQSLSRVDVASAIAWANSNSHKLAIQQSTIIVEDALLLCVNPYLACSFGKDSAVMLDIVLSKKPDIAVKFLRWEGESENLNNYDEVIVMYKNRYPSLNLCIYDARRESLSTKSENRWDVFTKKQPHDGYFVGLRCEESMVRRSSIKKLGVIYKKADGMIRVCPIAFLRQKDISAYVISKDLPMLDAYHSLGLETRTSSRIPRLKLRANAMALLRLHNPDGYDALKSKFPDEIF